MERKPNIICKNVFKSDSTKTRRNEFNQRWIELINYLEKTKGTIVQ